MRFLPHHNDDGGFFVAIIKKKGELNWPKTRRQTIAEPKIDKNFQMRRWKSRAKFYSLIVNHRQSLFKFFDESNYDLEKFRKFYGLDIKPELLYTTGNCESEVVNYVRLISPEIKDILTSNSDENLNVAHEGVTVIEQETRASTDVKYKFSQKSVHSISQLISKRIVEGTLSDAKTLLNVPFSRSSVDMLKMESGLQNDLRNLEFGGFVFLCKTNDFYILCPAFCSENKVLLDISETRRKQFLILLNGENLDEKNGFEMHSEQ